MVVNIKFLRLIAIFFAILCLLMHGQILCDGELSSQFISSEAEALLEFKEGLKDPSNLLSSWKLGKDCCQWKGVGCNTTTGHVISLNLHCSNSLDKLQGHLNSSLLQLPYLSYLNLSGNDFLQSRVPSFLGTMQNLKYLDLSHANFKESLFDNLGNLSLLESLDLSGNDLMQSGVPDFRGTMQNLKHLDLSHANLRGNLSDNLGNLSLLESLDLSGNSFYVNNLKWLHGLSSLKILDLSGVGLSICQNDWFHDISVILPSLETLLLSGCQLHKLPASPPHEMNFDSLLTLDLSENNFNSTIPDWLFEKCHHLQNLNLSENNFQGLIRNSIERLTTLETLDLSKNSLIGSIPNSIGMILSLVAIDLSYNMLSGSIPSTLGQNSLKELCLSHNRLNGSLERSIHQLSNLVVLNLAVNNFDGIISDVHLANFNNLKVLDLSFNHVTLNMSKNWVPPFQLETIGLANCYLGPQFPTWFQTQKNFSHIDISNTSVFDTVPNWFWDLSLNVEYMNLSHNELKRCGHDFSQKLKLKTLDLSNNKFSCPLPRLPPNSRTLDLSNNLFYGTISHVCEMLGVNNSLKTLDLSFNHLSGVIPNCWTNGSQMIILNLAGNNFIGSIPDSFGSLLDLRMLLIYNNNLSGKISDTLKNCNMLIFLDLRSNQLRGSIPSWIGKDLQILEVLLLGRNSFDENIPTSLCQLKSLKILDLSENKLTGKIPRCVFPAMATEESINEKSSFEFLTIKESLSIYLSKTQLPLLVRWKGVDRFFSHVRQFLKMIDLSSNSLTHEIPVEIGKLVELIALNLSRNQLVGSIPSNIGELASLEFLDLSMNNLSCAIPTSMANIERLSMLDLSYNNLSGEIPIGTQMQSCDESSYEGNTHLCGPPLTKACPKNRSFEDTHCNHGEEHENEGNHEDKVLGMEINPFYISMAVGFSTGFWVFWGSLILIASWRHAYFRFLGNMNDRIYVTVVVALNKLRRKFHTPQPPM